MCARVRFDVLFINGALIIYVMFVLEMRRFVAAAWAKRRCSSKHTDMARRYIRPRRMPSTVTNNIALGYVVSFQFHAFILFCEPKAIRKKWGKVDNDTTNSLWSASMEGEIWSWPPSWFQIGQEVNLIYVCLMTANKYCPHSACWIFAQTELTMTDDILLFLFLFSWIVVW